MGVTFQVGDRVMIPRGHPTFAPEWQGAYGHVVGIDPDPVADGRALVQVQIEGQTAPSHEHVFVNLGQVLGIIETALVHPD